MDKNYYHLLVEGKKDNVKTISSSGDFIFQADMTFYIYSNQQIPTINLPNILNGKNLNYKEDSNKFLVRLNDDCSEVIEIVESFNNTEWLYEKISFINLHNKNVINNKKNNIRNIIPMPDGIIMDPITWEFVLATIQIGCYPLFTGPTGCGKAGSLDSKLLTPTGWIYMKNVKLGDKVITQSGKPTKVTGVFPQGKKEIFKISFSDGASTECCEEHLWAVKNFMQRNNYQKKKGIKIKKEKEFEILQLKDFKNHLLYSNTHKNYSIPIVKPVEFEKIDSMLDSYFIGLLIGDGGLTQGINFSSEDEELINYIKKYIKKFNCYFKEDKKRGKTIQGNISSFKRPNIILEELKKMGLIGCKSIDKFIPNQYKYSSIEDRINLLQGLMDTDGHTSGISTTFHTSSSKLRDDVIELVRSLGGIAVFNKKIPKYKYKDEILLGQEHYNISIKFSEGLSPFRLKRKSQKYIAKTKYLPIRYIINVESIGYKEAQCISVEDESHLYITDDYIVTHNTQAAINIAAALGRQFYPLNCGSLLKPKSTLVGTISAKDGSTFVVPSEFLNYFQSDLPTLIFLDEISRIPSQGANALMTITDRNQSYIYVEEMAQRIYKGKDVIFIAAANFGMQYVDTRKLDNALLNRFIPYHLNYLNERDEIRLIMNNVPTANMQEVKKLVEIANILRKNYDSLGQEVSHRHMIDMARFLPLGFSYGEIVNNVLINLFVNGNDDRRDQVEQILNGKLL